jgi:hypothetical protein
MHDPKCYELAEYFYPNESGEFLNELAEEIQSLVEYLNPNNPESEV